MISPTAEYALRAIVALAQRDGQAVVTPTIADTTRVPAGYLAKVLQTLGRAGLVRSRRGLGGGFMLARPPAEITVLDVVNAVDPIKRIERCPLGIETHGAALCPLHHRIDEAIGQVERSFRETTIAELLGDESRNAPLCREGGTVDGVTLGISKG